MVNVPAFLVVIAVTMITTTWGVRLAHWMNPVPLKRAFAGFIMLMALNMLRKAPRRVSDPDAVGARHSRSRRAARPPRRVGFTRPRARAARP